MRYSFLIVGEGCFLRMIILSSAGHIFSRLSILFSKRFLLLFLQKDVGMPWIIWQRAAHRHWVWIGRFPRRKREKGVADKSLCRGILIRLDCTARLLKSKN